MFVSFSEAVSIVDDLLKIAKDNKLSKQRKEFMTKRKSPEN
jgi:hypothetical protein